MQTECRYSSDGQMGLRSKSLSLRTNEEILEKGFTSTEQRQKAPGESTPGTFFELHLRRKVLMKAFSTLDLYWEALIKAFSTMDLHCEAVEMGTLSDGGEVMISIITYIIFK